MDFVHLHVHSHFSLLTGLPKIKELVKTAKERGFKALALTDYGSMYGMIQFYEKCLEEGIKPLLGCELFLALQSRHDRRAKIDMSAYHLPMIAETFEGYQNIMRMSTIGHLEGFYYRPRIDKEVLRQYAKGVIAYSGCGGGEIPTMIRNGVSQEKVIETIREYVEIFGDGNFFLELQDHPEKEGQMQLNDTLVQLSKETGVPLIVTRDVHYLHTSDAEAQDVLTCIKDGRTLHEPGRNSFQHIDRSLCTGEEIARRFSHIPEALENTVKIAERCNVEVPIDQWHFPDVKLPEGKTAAEVLTAMTREGVLRRYSTITQEIEERLAMELDVIITRGYDKYFLAVSDYINWSKSKGIITTTRGSAAGSLVSYAIGITNVDPLRFRLPFERFLNPFRPTPPDVDGDFADYRRDEVIKYVTDTYGHDKVAQICTFGTMAARASIRDVGRALGYSYAQVDKVAKLVPPGAQGFPMTISRALEESSELKEVYDKNPEVKRMLDLAKKIEGCARHVSVHAAGVVICPEPLTNFTPLQLEPGGDKIITQYEMKSVEKAGVLKMDFLGLRNLSILEEAIRYVKKTKGVTVSIEEIPLDDTQTYEMLARGETGGLFQLSGPAMTRYLKELKPTIINDIMAMVALYRPGPMNSIPEYIARKNDPERITYIDKRLETILDMSYGVMTYQDDVLLTSIQLAGYSWGEADKLRKAMGKKIPEEMVKQKIKFHEGAVANGMTSAAADELWALIEPFAAYGFNKAHAASYGIIAYYTAYMKAHFPGEYMAAVLSCEAGNMETVAENILECRRMGIPVLAPDINESFELFGVVYDEQGARIRFGLGAIKNVGTHIAQVIIAERKARGHFTSLEDLFIRVRDKDLNKKTIEALIKTGALERYGERGLLLANVENLLNFSREVGGMSASQDSLFGNAFESLKVKLDEAPAMGAFEALRYEKELLGLYVSGHPCELMQDEWDTRLQNIGILGNDTGDAWACVCGVISNFKKMITKKGDIMCFITLEDHTGTVEVVVFPRAYAVMHEFLVDGTMIVALGKKDTKDGGVKILMERGAPVAKGQLRQVVGDLLAPKIEEVESSQLAESKPKEITLLRPSLVCTVTQEQFGILPQFHELLRALPDGDVIVYIHVPTTLGPKFIETPRKVLPKPEFIAQVETDCGISVTEYLE